MERWQSRQSKLRKAYQAKLDRNADAVRRTIIFGTAQAALSALDKFRKAHETPNVRSTTSHASGETRNLPALLAAMIQGDHYCSLECLCWKIREIPQLARLLPKLPGNPYLLPLPRCDAKK